MKNKLIKLICLILTLCISLALFAGCKKQGETTNTSSDTADNFVDDEYQDDEYQDDEYEDDEYQDDEYEDDFEDYEDDWEDFEDEFDDWEEEEEFEESLYEQELFINNKKPINENFLGFNMIHQLYNYIPDKYDRMNTEKQIAHELDTMEKMGVDMIRSFYGPSLAWDPETGKFDWDNAGMQAFYKNCKDMEKIGIEVGITPQWSFSGFIPTKNEETGEYEARAYGSYVGLYFTGFTALPSNTITMEEAFEATLKGHREFVRDSVLAFKAHGITNVKQLFAYTEVNNTLSGLGWYEDQEATLDERRMYDTIIPMYDKAVRALDAGLKDAGLRENYEIVGPCDNWRDDQNSPESSRMVDYALENLTDVIDIIGTHYGYDRANEYINDQYYDIPFDKIPDPLNKTREKGMRYFIDEYNASDKGSSASAKRETMGHPWKGVAIGAMANAVMNLGVDNLYLWTLYDQQWPGMGDTSGGEAPTNSEFHQGIQINGFLPALQEATIPRPAWYVTSLLTKYVDQGALYGCEVDIGVYASCIKRNDGEWTIIVTNYNLLDATFKINIEDSLGGKDFYRHLYVASDIKPVAGNEMLNADKVIKGVEDAFIDTLPAGSVAVYTTVKD
ncbi:MAG: hypothetical protein IJE01_01260 [Clostridia bacterium]|nr:hypothetical protein [Clostridia bacterium]